MVRGGRDGCRGVIRTGRPPTGHVRRGDPRDKRRKLLWVTPEGEQAVRDMTQGVRQVQSRLVAPLDGAEQVELVRLLEKLVAGHEAQASAAVLR